MTHFRRPSRRAFLQVGAVGALGLTLDDYFRLRAAAAAKPQAAPAESLIHIFLPGGMAHQESFDPKPYAPSSIAARWAPCKPSSTASSSTST